MSSKVAYNGYRPGSLATAADLRRELGRLYRDGRTGLVSTADAMRLANIIGIMARLIETSDLELRFERLEEFGRERSSDVFEAH